MRIFWFYYRSIALVAIVLALFLSVLEIHFGPTGSSFKLTMGTGYFARATVIYSFISFPLISLWDAKIFKNKKYIYYNLGYSRRFLFMTVCCFNLLITIVLCLIFH